MMKQKPIKKLLLICLLMLCMMLTGCYKDMDPWPASPELATVVPPTAAPTAQPVADVITAIPAPSAPVQTEMATSAPVSVEPDTQDFWDDEPTPMPGGSAEPGTNG